jgi:hypothetical protein
MIIHRQGGSTPSFVPPVARRKQNHREMIRLQKSEKGILSALALLLCLSFFCGFGITYGRSITHSEDNMLYGGVLSAILANSKNISNDFRHNHVNNNNGGNPGTLRGVWIDQNSQPFVSLDFCFFLFLGKFWSVEDSNPLTPYYFLFLS